MQALSHVVVHSGMEMAFIHKNSLKQLKQALSLAVTEAGERQREAFRHQKEETALANSKPEGGRERSKAVASRGASKAPTEEPAGPFPSSEVEAGSGEELWVQELEHGVALRLLVVWGGISKEEEINPEDEVSGSMEVGGG